MSLPDTTCPTDASPSPSPREDEEETDSFHCHQGQNENGLEPEPGRKKKKKKAKKSASVKAREAKEREKEREREREKEKPPPAVLCISRNKHWKYISSYHGPWLQLPLELLESLLALNLDPATLSPPASASIEHQQQSLFGGNGLPAISNLPYNKLRSTSSSPNPNPNRVERDRGFHHLSSLSPQAGAGTFTNPNGLPPTTTSLSFSLNPNHLNGPHSPSPPPIPTGTSTPPPPIDPGVFRNVASIRRLIDEAAELSVRASSGLSAAELRASGGGGGGLESLGLGLGGFGGGGGGYGGGGGGGRNVAMSAMRIHRLRALAVQKLAQAYKADEIASSVMVMQGGSVFDDVAEKVLRVDPNDIDAKYVNFFHEKIPSRQLAESTTTQTLDELIAAQPQRLEFYRTRGIVHCFKDEYGQATKDFTFAIKEARAARKAKMSHVHGDVTGGGVNGGGGGGGGGGGKGKGGGNGGGGGKANGKKKGNNNKQRGKKQGGGEKAAASDLGGGGEDDSSETASTTSSSPSAHPSTHPYPASPDPIEPQLLFLRGAAYLSHAVHLIESAVLKLEGIEKKPTLDGAELRLCYLEEGRYGGVEVGNPDGPLGRRGGEKVRGYREAFLGVGEREGAGAGAGAGKKEKGKGLRERVETLLNKSIRDHERFLAHFDSLESGPGPIGVEDLRPSPSQGEGEQDEGRWDWVREGRHVELLNQTEYAFHLSESIRPGSHQHQHPSVSPPPPSPHHHYSHSTPAFPATFTTYHPLLVESHFSILLSLLLLGDFASILGRFARTAGCVEGLEGYPVFLPPRSMAQAEFVEVLERLAGGWKVGCASSFAERERQAQAQAEEGTGRGKGKMIAVEVPDLNLTPTARIEEYDGTWIPTPTQGESSSSSSATTPRSSTPDTPSTTTFTSTSTSWNPACTPQSQWSGGTPPPLPPTTTWVKPRPDAVEALECARILLAPVLARQRQCLKEDKGLVKLNGNGNGKKPKPVPINIPLHGPRVEVVLAWMGGVVLPEIED
ncbi:hypothetical protein V5O48_013574 [Marasmius crinis-equi]|uniref:Uncharacterized protein n=1 Tax=Marasmius crinis-equi TaxID=585013 RepID=A0ABR3EZN9_9AGAR